MKYYLYILKSKTADKYYTGISQNPERRLTYHNSIERGFTSRYRPWAVEFTKEYENREQAHQAELKVKSWKSKEMVEKLVRGEIQF